MDKPQSPHELSELRKLALQFNIDKAESVETNQLNHALAIYALAIQHYKGRAKK